MLDARVQTRAMPAGMKVWYQRLYMPQFHGLFGSSAPSQSSIGGSRSSGSVFCAGVGTSVGVSSSRFLPDSRSSESPDQDFLELLDDDTDMKEYELEAQISGPKFFDNVRE